MWVSNSEVRQFIASHNIGTEDKTAIITLYKKKIATNFLLSENGSGEGQQKRAKKSKTDIPKRYCDLVHQ